MRIKPYVGITGPIDIKETSKICTLFSNLGYSLQTPHIPMLGFLVSYKTLNNQKVSNKRYPSLENLSEMLVESNEKVLSMIHYNSKEVDSLSDQITKVFDRIYQENLCRAVQLNIPWPNLAQVEKIKKKFTKMQIVFQASQEVLEGKTPFQVAKRIKDYSSLIEYVLLDPSGGRSLPFSLDSSISFYSEIKEKCPQLTLGFAGGFTGENVPSRVKTLIKKLKNSDFCIDAEGGLRDKLSTSYGDDLLNLNKVKKYLVSASSTLK